MLLNIFLLAAFIALGYWWSLQGFFSALVHLLIVVAAGALALAIWEPLSNLLFPILTTYTWGVCLLVPFIVFLLIGRKLVDKFARGDVRLHPAVDYTGGAVCGVLTVWVSAGLTIIAIGFLPLPAVLLGYQPLIIKPDGGVEYNSSADLWFHVDTRTAGFYTFLSEGAFGNSTALAFYQPDLARQASLFRMGYDPNASMVAIPGSVTIGDCFDADTPVTYIEDSGLKELPEIVRKELLKPGYRLVAIKTAWHIDPRGTYDRDQSLRVFPTQIRLVSVSDQPVGPGQAVTELEAPIAFSREDPSTHARVFHGLNDDSTFLYSQAQTTKACWIFLISGDRHAQFLLARHSRLELTESKRNDRDDMMAVIGGSPQSMPVLVASASAAGGAESNKPGNPVGPPGGLKDVGIDITNALPDTVSANSAASLTIHAHGVVYGDGNVAHVDRVDQEVAVDHIEIRGNQAAVRATVARGQAESLLGKAVSAAQSLNPVYLQSDMGDKYFVIGYDLDRASDQTQVIHVDLDNPLQSSRQLPARSMQEGDVLYLYFAVPKGTTLTEFHIGEKTFQSFNILVPK